MELQDIERALHCTRVERQRLEELEKAYRMIIDLMAVAGKPSLEKLSQTDAVRESIERMKGQFTAADIAQDLRNGFREPIPKPHISAILTELAKSRFVRIVHKGAGRRPSVYERIG